DHDARDQLELLRAGTQESEQDEYFVEGALVGIRGATAKRVEAVKRAPQHVVEYEQMIVARALGGLRVVPDDGRIRADFRLRKHHSELHVDASSIIRSRIL